MTSTAVKNRTSHYICPPELLPERPIIPGEDPAVWDVFRDHLLATLDPGSFLEHELAERVALQMWRFRRASRYEADVATDEFQSARTLSIVNAGYLEPDDPVSKALLQQIQEIEEQSITLAQLQSARELLRQLPNLTNNTALDPSQVAILTAMVGIKDPNQIPQPMTAGVVRRALANWSRRSIPEALKWAAALADEKCKSMAERLTGMGARKEQLLADMRHVIESRQRDRTLLPKPALERALRYEAHVSRQLTQALKLLREFKDERLAKVEHSLGECGAPPPQLPVEEDRTRGASVPPLEEDRTRGASAPPSEAATRSFRNFAEATLAATVVESSFGKNDGLASRTTETMPSEVASECERSAPDVLPDRAAPASACPVLS